jgi:alanyl-tRNA synthetase
VKQKYMTDSYLRECKTIIVGHHIEKKKSVIVCHDNIFYPKSGGQPCDIGTIVVGDIQTKVKKVKKVSGDVWVFLEQLLELSDNQEVLCEIDWKRRYNHMKCHSASHVVMSMIQKHIHDFSSDSIEIISDNEVILKFTGTWRCSDEVAHKIVSESNELIFKNLKIYCEVFKDFETAFNKYKNIYRGSQEPKISGDLRLVIIQDLDANPCAGTHVEKLSEIGSIELVDYTANEFKIRVTAAQP